MAAACAYVLAFAWQQTPGLFDRHVLEWDARAMVLPAWRYHASGLFANDLVVDLAAIYDPPGWKAVYWLGTLFTDPFTISKLLPFGLLLVLVWHGYQLGRHFGGRVLGAATVIALVHCTFLWNRMAGGHARSFGYPLMVMFLRYAATGCERRALGTLLLQALFYPSAFVVAAPAWMSVIARKGWPAWRRFALVGGLAVAIVAVAQLGDPRLGNPPTRAQAATLKQMKPGGPQPYYPLPAALGSIADVLEVPWRSDGGWWRGIDSPPVHATLVLSLLAGVIFLARRRLARVPLVFATLALSSLGMFGLAYALAYRLYLPDRMLLYSWPPLVLLGLPLAVYLALEPRLGERAAPVAASVVVAFLVIACGDGLPRSENLTDFTAHDSAAIRYVATLPRDILVATQPERASFVQTFALRRTLFSASLNVPFYYGYAVEMEQRIDAFYRAYYAPDLATVARFVERYHVDYLILDERDFGPDARRRARYYEPWQTLAGQLLDRGPADSLALAHPPTASIAFRDGTRLVIDARKLVSATGPLPEGKGGLQ